MGVFHSNLEDVARLVREEVKTNNLKLNVLQGEMRAQGKTKFCQFVIFLF
jgi:hypothetical protein